MKIKQMTILIKQILKIFILICVCLQFITQTAISQPFNQPQNPPSAARAIIYDSTPPTTPIVVDDGEFTNNRTQLHASWSSSDPQSGIVEYRYAVGTAQGLVDVVNWTSAGLNTEVTHLNLNLEVGLTYYFSVKSKNGANLWSNEGYSDGITVVNNPPEIISLLPENNSSFTEGDSINIEVQATDDDNDDLEYRFLVEGSVLQDWSTSNTCLWQTQQGDVRLKTISAEVRDEFGGFAALDTHVFLYRQVPKPE